MGKIEAAFPEGFNTPTLDELAVDKLSIAMLEKLAAKAALGARGWETCSEERLRLLLQTAVNKGDPVDIANYCAMLYWQRTRPSPAA